MAVSTTLYIVKCMVLSSDTIAASWSFHNICFFFPGTDEFTPKSPKGHIKWHKVTLNSCFTLHKWLFVECVQVCVLCNWIHSSSLRCVCGCCSSTLLHYTQAHILSFSLFFLHGQSSFPIAVYLSVLSHTSEVSDAVQRWLGHIAHKAAVERWKESAVSAPPLVCIIQ